MSDATISSGNPPVSDAPEMGGAGRLGLHWLDEPRVQLGIFATTLFASALLLFTVQPMFAKMALPKLGGSPSVWAVSMCFFQAALLGGYLYAHALNKYLAPRIAVFAHLTVLAITLLALPIGLPARLGEPPEGDAYVWLIGVLALGVGLPFFAVSANAPLLQAWFARTGHPHAKDPYFLYGASNLGSLLALLAYPLAIEPLMGAGAQTRAWSLGFFALGGLIAVSGALMLWLMASNKSAEAASTSETAAADITNSDRLLWIALAALPSGLMVAVTTFVTTDIASAPFLWVVPLALFLLTFILVFKDKTRIPFEFLAILLPAVALIQIVVPGRGLRMILAMVGFFIAALICHRQLYLRRPAAKHLTEFYLWMSAGGMIGGVFSALIAPQIFTSVFEFHVLLAAALFCVPGIFFGATAKLDMRRIGGLGCIALAILLGGMILGDIYGPKGQTMAMVILIAGICIAMLYVREWPEQRVAFMIGVAAVMLAMPDSLHSVYVERSFFGTVRVVDTSDGQHRLMLHGTTLHGARRMKSEDGSIVTHSQPMTYYHPDGAMARGFAVARAAKSTDVNPQPKLVAGLVGLGTGSLACFAKPGDAMSFYEIDPVVVKVARDTRFFDFLARCTPNAPMIVGDARQTIGREADGRFDYLVIDAFSSDTVPVHMITVEALEMYLGKIADNGLLALHISNRYMDLPSAVSATVAELKDASGVFVHFQPKKTDSVDAAASDVVFLAKNPKVLDAIRAWPDAEGLPRTRASAWTDDFSDVLSAVVRQVWK